ncbi:non-ribosomal peptide synthetase, partial [Lysobacter tyrosinilyticus]
MSLSALMERLHEKGIAVHVREGELVVRAPKGAMDPQTLELLKQHKAALLETLPQEGEVVSGVGAVRKITPDLLPLVKLTQEEIDSVIAQVSGGVSNIQDIYPLAPLQGGILFHHMLQDDAAGDTYLLRSVVAFDGRDRLDAFLGALQKVIDRHDILRSAIHWDGLPQPVQVVQRRAPLPLHELDVPPDAEALPHLLERADPRRMRLDLRHGPLLAAHVTQDRTSGEWLLALLSHHIVCDHVAMSLVMGEIEQLLLGNGDRLPKPLPYRNFIARTHAVPDAEHESYFRAQLGDIDAPTAPFDVLDVQGDGTVVAKTGMRFDDSMSQRIRDAARNQGVAPSVLFHAAWAQVLGQCTGRDDVVFGTVLTGRLQGSEGADQVVGMFLNTLPIRMSLSQLSTGDAVRDAYQRLSDLLVHEQASLALAQRCSAVQSPLPLFTTLLNYRHSHGADSAEAEAESAGSAWNGVRMLSGETRNNYPLTMSVEDYGWRFGLTALSVPGIDGPRVVRYMATAVEALVAALEAGGTTPLQRLSVLPLEEREQVLIGFNSNRTNDAHDRTIHSLFEAQVAAHPDAEALRYEGASLSYAELNRRANQVAHKLLALGVQPDERVAVCTERSLAMIVGVLGVLKAGAAYVPVDPSYPSDRIAYMLSDSRPKAVLTQAALVPTLPGSDAPVLVIDGNALEGEGINNPTVAGLTSRHLAYVIYTSGSTGQPKGVMVEHRSAVNFWRVMGQTTHRELAPHSRVALNAAFSFDMSLKGILQLLSGHCLVLIPQELRANGPAMVSFLEAERIAALDSTPSQLEVLLSAGLLEPTGPRPVSVYLGGEPVGRVLWERLKASPVIHFHNMYGPTECTVDATIGSIRESAGGPVIGRPIANTPVYVLDTHGEPVPVGVAGELFLGGVQVARGYLDRPELTAERFLQDPFSAVPDARMYKTGDLGRWLPDGTLEYLG